MLDHKLSSILLFLAGLALAGCQAPAGAGEPMLQWTSFPNWSSDRAKQGKILLHWANPIGEAGLDGLAEVFRAQAEKQGYVMTRDHAEADYVYFVSLRYFGVNPGADRGNTIVAAAQDIVGGHDTWHIDGQGLDPKVRTISAVRVDEPEKGFMSRLPLTGAAEEYAFLLDISIGEVKRHGGPDSTSATTLRREARAVGWVTGVEGGRQEALQKFKEKAGAAFATIFP